MPKRKRPDEEDLAEVLQSKGPVKNSLDSDEEDDNSDEERYELKDEDIEGQEDGVVGTDEGIQITPFNMNEELEEGHFDTDGMYHWNKEKVIKDSWLENIDWIKVKQTTGGKDADKTNEDEEMPEAVDVKALYKQILTYLLPKETIAKALKRHGGSKSLSASERLKLKKSGLSYNSMKGDGAKVSELTELANKILTHTGNMDIYQETFEFISDQVNSSGSKAAGEELDMYADDFADKEKERLIDGPTDAKDEPTKEKTGGELMWEYKSKEDSTDIQGPFTTAQMNKWSSSGHFGSGVLVRKSGTEQFYTSNRIDFELYI